MQKQLKLALCLLLLTACKAGPPKDLPAEAITAAFAFCPETECSAMTVGPSTRKLPYPEGTFRARWCVEVLFTRDGQNYKGAADVADLPLDGELGGWHAAKPVLNSDCSYFDNEKP